MDEINFNFDFKKSISDGKTYIFGAASTNEIDRDGELIDIESLKSAFDRFLNLNPVLLYNHDINKVIGKILPKFEGESEMYESGVIDNKLMVIGVLSDTAGDIEIQINEGNLKSFSVGGKGSLSPNGQLKMKDLYEISVVPIGANKDAVFDVVKTIKGDEFMVNETEMEMIVEKAVKAVQDAQIVESEDQTIIKGLNKTIDSLKTELKEIKTKTVQKGIVETEIPSEEKSIFDVIMNKFYMEA